MTIQNVCMSVCRHWRRPTTWLAGVLIILGPALPVWAQQIDTQPTVAVNDQYLYEGHPIVVALQSVRSDLGIPTNWTPGEDVTLGDIVMHSGSLIRASDGTYHINVSFSQQLNSGELVSLGVGQAVLQPDGTIDMENHFETDTEVFDFSSTMGVSPSGQVILKTDLLQTGDFVDVAIESGLPVDNGDEETFGGAVLDILQSIEARRAVQVTTNVIKSTASVADNTSRFGQNGPQTRDPISVAAALVFVIIVIVVAAVIVVCTYGALLRRFFCEAPLSKRRFDARGALPWMIEKRVFA